MKEWGIMEVNILAFIATALFVLVPTAFLIIIYVKTVSETSKDTVWCILMNILKKVNFFLILQLEFFNLKWVFNEMRELE